MHTLTKVCVQGTHPQYRVFTGRRFGGDHQLLGAYAHREVEYYGQVVHQSGATYFLVIMGHIGNSNPAQPRSTAPFWSRC